METNDFFLQVLEQQPIERQCPVAIRAAQRGDLTPEAWPVHARHCPACGEALAVARVAILLMFDAVAASRIRSGPRES